MPTIKELFDISEAATAESARAREAMLNAKHALAMAVEAHPLFTRYKRGDVITHEGRELQVRYAMTNGHFVNYSCAERTQAGTWKVAAQRVVKFDTIDELQVPA